MKQRFSSLDVKVIAHELNESLVSLRLGNIYDLSSRILLLKFAKPDVKQQLVVDTGFRCHLTDFSRTTAAAPSPFCARLRKSLKTRRLTRVSQVGTDRILEFQFSDGQYRLFLEFFASGNLILTDADLKILALSRTVSEAEGQETQRVGTPYSLENRQNYPSVPPLTKERVREALSKAVERAAQNPSTAKKFKSKPGGELRKSLAVSITEVPPVMVDHSLQVNNFPPETPITDILASEELLDLLLECLAQARETAENITSTSTCKGYIIAKYRTPPSVNDQTADDESQRANLLYDDFHPIIPHKFKDDPSVQVIEIDGYNRTVDEFFSSLEGQKLESRLTEREAQAKKRLDHAKQEQRKRIEGLQEAQTIHLRKAAAIEANVERVQEAMDAVNGLIAQGMDWVNIGKLIEREKKRGNPVADIIKLPLNLEENMVTLNLAEEEFQEEEEGDPFETDEEESDDESSAAKEKTKALEKGLSVEINLAVSPWSNAREYYEQRRTAAVKEEKTQAQAVRALKNTELRINEDLKKGLKQEKALLLLTRKQMWFEKFIWFISSDGYLVLGGKDASQHEILYRRHLRKGDVYCHADLKGASIVIIKNNPKTPDAPIPPATLSQAGTLSVCSSDVWDSKAGMGAWWVNAEQVSKEVAPGEFLPPGNFVVNGNKNFLPPAQLVIGLGFLFRISDESKAQHVKHRVGHEEAIYNPASGAKQKELLADAEDEPSLTADGGAADEDDIAARPESVYDGQSDNESDAGNEDADKRENPLQSMGDGKDDSDSLDAVETGVSKLEVQEGGAAGAEPPSEGEGEGEARQDDAELEDGETAQDATDLASEAPTDAPSRGTDAPSKQAPAKRGKRGKAKKIANKYRYQDEEDRTAAEALIGATAGRQKAEAEAKAKAEREAELEAAKERRRAQHEKRQQQTAEHEEARRAKMMASAADDGDEDEDELLAEAATSLDGLVGTPLAGDEILEIIPVCAPWSALGKLKYKAKMQPGSTKKGKAVREVLDRLRIASEKKGVVDEHSQDKQRMWPKEVELLKGLKPEEVVNCIPVGKVRVMMAGGTSGSGGGSGGGKGAGGKGGKGKGRGAKK